MKDFADLGFDQSTLFRYRNKIADSDLVTRLRDMAKNLTVVQKKNAELVKQV